MFGMEHARIWRGAAAGVVISALAAASGMSAAEEPTIEELKERVADAKVVDRPPLCLQISERQVGAAGRFYIAGDSEQMKAALNDVVTFSEMARDSAIQSHKHEKQSEIAIRKMIRKLSDLKHAVGREEQEQVQATIDHLQHFRDDLLVAMFPKVGKK
jgi:hypothetical protein